MLCLPTERHSWRTSESLGCTDTQRAEDSALGKKGEEGEEERVGEREQDGAVPSPPSEMRQPAANEGGKQE